MAKTKIDLLTTGGVLWSLFQKVVNAILAVCQSDTARVNDILHTLNSDDDEGCQLREDVASLVSGQTAVARKVVDVHRGLDFELLGRKCIAVKDTVTNACRVEIGDALLVVTDRFGKYLPKNSRLYVFEIDPNGGSEPIKGLLFDKIFVVSPRDVIVKVRFGGEETPSW